MNVPNEVIDFLNKYNSFFIVGHGEPDGDCLGSQIGIHSYITSMGKQATLFSPGPFSRPEITRFSHLFITDVPEPFENTALIVVDCSTQERIGDFAALIKTMPSLVIDHHASGKEFGNIRWIDSTVPAVTLMIKAIFNKTGISIDLKTKKALLLGLATDTGFFRHLESEAEWVLSEASELVQSSVNPKSIYKMMYGDREINSRILLGRILSRVKTHFNGCLLTSFETLEDKQQLGENARDSDLLYSLLMGTKDMDALFIIREETEDRLSVGLRSLAIADVSKIAHSFGGGGHKRAAGFQSNKPREILHKELIDIFSDIFSQ